MTPKDATAFREELDLGDPALINDKSRWIVVVHYGNHFELVYRSDQLGFVLPLVAYLMVASCKHGRMHTA